MIWVWENTHRKWLAICSHCAQKIYKLKLIQVRTTHKEPVKDIIYIDNEMRLSYKIIQQTTYDTTILWWHMDRTQTFIHPTHEGLPFGCNLITSLSFVSFKIFGLLLKSTADTIWNVFSWLSVFCSSPGTFLLFKCYFIQIMTI